MGHQNQANFRIGRWPGDRMIYTSSIRHWNPVVRWTECSGKLNVVEIFVSPSGSGTRLALSLTFLQLSTVKFIPFLASRNFDGSAERTLLWDTDHGPSWILNEPWWQWYCMCEQTGLMMTGTPLRSRHDLAYRMTLIPSHCFEWLAVLVLTTNPKTDRSNEILEIRGKVVLSRSNTTAVLAYG